MRAGRVWTLLSYGFLHDTRNLLHIVGNLLGLYFLGRVLLPMLGATRFLSLYAAMVLVGAAAWAAANWHVGGTLVGASAGVAGLFVVFACFYPNQPVTFLLLFIVPVTLKPKYIAIAALLIDLAGFIFYEVMGLPSPFGFAHSAHLGGMAAGWIYYRYLHEANWHLPSRSRDIELPKWMKKAAAKLPLRRRFRSTSAAAPATSAPRWTASSTRSTVRASARSPRRKNAGSTRRRTC